MNMGKTFFLLFVLAFPFLLLSFVLGGFELSLAFASLFLLISFLIHHSGDKVLLFLLKGKRIFENEGAWQGELTDFYSFRFNIQRPPLYLTDRAILGVL